jgi:hypothetical protein
MSGGHGKIQRASLTANFFTRLLTLDFQLLALAVNFRAWHPLKLM